MKKCRRLVFQDLLGRYGEIIHQVMLANLTIQFKFPVPRLNYLKSA